MNNPNAATPQMISKKTMLANRKTQPLNSFTDMTVY